MNLEKANLKAMVANSLGADLEDRLDSEMKAANEMAGAAEALRQASVKVPRDLSAKVDLSLKEGEIAEGMTSLEVAGLIKKYLTKAGSFLSHLSDVERQKATMQLGRVEGIKQAMGVVQEVRDTEAQRIQAYVEAQKEAQKEEGEAPDLRTSGSIARKKRGSAADRKAAESSDDSSPDPRAAEQAAKEAQGSLSERRSGTKKKAAKKKTPAKKKTKKKAAKGPKLRAVKRAVPSDG